MFFSNLQEGISADEVEVRKGRDAQFLSASRASSRSFLSLSAMAVKRLRCARDESGWWRRIGGEGLQVFESVLMNAFPILCACNLKRVATVLCGHLVNADWPCASRSRPREEKVSGLCTSFYPEPVHLVVAIIAERCYCFPGQCSEALGMSTAAMQCIFVVVAAHLH